MGVCRFLIRKSLVAIILLVGFTFLTGMLGKRIPGSFLPEEDQGYFFAQVILPDASSFQRTDEVMEQCEEILKATPGVEYVSTVTGYNFLTGVNTSYSGVFFISLKEWGHRKAPDEQYAAILKHVNGGLRKLPGATAFAFSPPAIPGIGASGGVTFLLQDRSGKDVAFLAENVAKFVAAAREKKELTGVTPMFSPAVPQIFLNVDRDKVLKQNIDLSAVYQTLQTFMGSYFVNYFNRFGRQWQVFVQAEGDYRTNIDQVGQFFVKNKDGAMVPLSAVPKSTGLGPRSPDRSSHDLETVASEVNYIRFGAHTRRRRDFHLSLNPKPTAPPESENLDIESITEARRKAIEQTVEPIDIGKLKSLGEKIFPFLDHPWRHVFFQFLEENTGNSFYYATTNDQVEIIYCPAKAKRYVVSSTRKRRPLEGQGTENHEGNCRRAINLRRCCGKSLRDASD